MIAFLLSIMTPYEWSRVILNLGQLIAMIVIPFIVLNKKVKLTYTNDTDEENKKDK